jgi:hypothetical protein
LDVAVASAYGWPPDIAEKDALEALLEFNAARTTGGPSEVLDEETAEEDD